MKALIIDDEERARNLLSTVITNRCEHITDLKTASDLEEGIEVIKELQPHIVFLDIEMPNYSGLQILDFFKPEEVNFQIIFTTAYDQYAIQAFKLSAVDYLLKPINVQELLLAINKAAQLIQQKSMATNIKDLKQTFQKLSLNTIILEVPKGVLFTPFEEIKYFEADGMYTKVYLTEDRIELICKPIKFFSNQLEENQLFFKPHRSYLINIKHVRQLTRQDGVFLTMSDQKNIPISKDKKDEFIELANRSFNI